MKGLVPMVLLAALVLVEGAASSSSALTGRFLMAYVAGGAERLAQSRDGVRWTSVSGLVAEEGTSPSLVRRGATLYLFDGFRVVPEGLTGALQRVRVGDGAVTGPVEISVQLSTPQDLQRASAVEASVALDSARRLTVVFGLRFEPETNACPVPGQACLKLRTATEAAGSDGTLFTGDPGNRAVLGFSPDADARDPTAVASAKGYLVLLAGPRACLRLLTAKDLRTPYRSATALPGSCLESELEITSPSGAYRPLLKEHWLYAVAEGRVVRASTRTLARPLPARRFRALRLPSAGPVTSARFVANIP